MHETNKRWWIYFLPNIFTCLNIACGFMAIMLALRGDFYKASIFIIVGGMFDSVDGRIARMLGAESSFGEQFDSMSDILTFGVAPALVYYLSFLQESGRIGMFVTFLFILCGATRLARFNANIDRVPSDYFQGLPIPLGAMTLVGVMLLSVEFPQIVEWKGALIAYILFYAVLMVSNIPFPSFKHSEWVKNHKRETLLMIFLMISLMVMFERYFFIVMMTIYVVSSFIYFFTHRRDFKGIFS